MLLLNPLNMNSSYYLFLLYYFTLRLLSYTTALKTTDHSSLEIKSLAVKNLNQQITNIDLNILRKQDSDASFNGEFQIIKRYTKFYISKSIECNVMVNDTVVYKKDIHLNFIEHWILHNNAEDIIPKSVNSSDVKVTFFTFNKKMNIFSVYFEDNRVSNDTSTSHANRIFTLEYLYDATNIIKTVSGEVSNTGEVTSSPFDENNPKIFTMFPHNELVWKIYNRNYYYNPENLSVEFIFDLGGEFAKYDLDFGTDTVKFVKTIEYEENDKMKVNPIVKYAYNGMINSQDVLIFVIELPLYFAQCKYSMMNFLMVMAGSVFIIFIIGMLYVVFSSVFFEDL